MRKHAFPTLKKHKRAGFFAKFVSFWHKNQPVFSPILQERSFVFTDLLASLVQNKESLSQESCHGNNLRYRRATWLSEDAKSETDVVSLEPARLLGPFDLQIPVRWRAKGEFFGHLLSFLAHFALKSQFVLCKRTKPTPLFALDHRVRSVKKTSFFHFRGLFPLAGRHVPLPPQLAGALSTTPIGYHKLVLMSREICRRQKVRYQASGVGSRGLGK